LSNTLYSSSRMYRTCPYRQILCFDSATVFYGTVYEERVLLACHGLSVQRKSCPDVNEFLSPLKATPIDLNIQDSGLEPYRAAFLSLGLDFE
jgi:hypothetical protein